jgi:hypothetical protein
MHSSPFPSSGFLLTEMKSISRVVIVDNQRSLLETKDIRVSIPQVFHVLVLNNVTCSKH